MTSPVAERYEQARPEVRRLVHELLDQDRSNQAWAEQIGSALTVASWLTAANDELDGRRPVDALADGDADAVVRLARRLARAAA